MPPSPGAGPGVPAPGYPAPPPGGSYPAPPPGVGRHPASSASAERQAHLVLDLKYHWSVFTISVIAPLISINGYLVPGRWGRNVIPVPPGQSRVHVHVPYPLLSRIGPADTTVWLEPGQVVELEYRAPLWMFSAGALGPAPQRWPGKAYLYFVVVIWLGFMLIITLSLMVD